MTFLELNEENINKIVNEVINHTYYGDEKRIIHDILNQYPYNNNLNEFEFR